MEAKNLKSALNRFGKDVVIDIKQQLLKLDAVASGKLLKSINYKLAEVVQSVEIKLSVFAESYWENVNAGRKPNSKQPPLKNIQQWVKLKGLPTKSSFPISVKIGRYGIKPKPFLKEVLSDRNPTINKFSKLLEENYRKDLEIELENITKQLS